MCFIQKVGSLGNQRTVLSDLPFSEMVPANLFYGELETKAISNSKVYSCPIGQIGQIVSEIHCVCASLDIASNFTLIIVFV